MDANSPGLIECTLPNWMGLIYKIPRDTLGKAKDILYLYQTGIYFLFGESEAGEPMVYIGKGDVLRNGRGVIRCIREHRRNGSREHWDEAIVLTTANNSLRTADVTYLENRFCRMANAAGRYRVNKNFSPLPITEKRKFELERVIELTKLVVSSLGYKVFEPIDGEPEIAEFLYFKTASAEAKGKRTEEGFIVLAGSRIALKLQKSCSETVRRARKKHANKIDENGVLLEDIVFASPSGASSFIGGSCSNGSLMWRNEAGKTLKELDNKPIRRRLQNILPKPDLMELRKIDAMRK